MTRSVSGQLATAITHGSAFRMLGDLLVEPLRQYYSAASATQTVQATSSDPYQPRAESFMYSASRTKTFLAHIGPGSVHSQTIWITKTPTGNNLEIAQSGAELESYWNAGIGFIEVSNTGYLYYLDSTNDYIVKATINMATLDTGTANCVTAQSNLDTTPPSVKGRLHAISNDECVYVYADNGGIGVTYYDGSLWNPKPGLLFSSGYIYNNSWDPQFSAAVKFNSDIFVYFTDRSTGRVLMTRYSVSEDWWSDWLEVIPADLSDFLVTNAIVQNSYIFLAGQFRRKEELDNNQVYNLATYSEDGYGFALSRETLFTKLDGLFQIATSGTTFYGGFSDKVVNGSAIHPMASLPTTQGVAISEDDVVGFSIEEAVGGGTATVDIADADQAYAGNSVIDKNNLVQLNVGYVTNAGTETILYGTYIITNKRTRYADGQRLLHLNLMQEAAWRFRTFSSPLYTEIASRSGIATVEVAEDGAANNLYGAPLGGKVSSVVSVDWWHHESWEYDASSTGLSLESGGGPGPTEISPSTTYSTRTTDLLEAAGLSNYPVVNSAEDVTVKIYGWCRTGQTGEDNPVLKPILWLKDEEGNEVVLDNGTLDSTYDEWPQTYFDTASGSYPVIYAFDTDIQAGWTITRIGLVITNPANTGNSWINIERIDIEGINVIYEDDSASIAWKAQDTGRLKVPEIGKPYVMFSTRPYVAHHFQVGAYFIINKGTNPVTTGTVGWGLVGHAQDGRNYIMARANDINSRFEIVQVVDGVEDVLGFNTFATGGTPAYAGHFLFFDFKNGIYRMYLFDPVAKEMDNVLTVNYDGSTQPICPSKDGIMHVGIYGEIAPPSFRTPGFDIDDADGIMMISGEDPTTLNDFPASGSVVLDGVRYGYASKTGTARMWGPYQARNTAFHSNYQSTLNDGTFDFKGFAVEVAHFSHNAAGNYAEDYFLGSENGHTWLIDGDDSLTTPGATDWRPLIGTPATNPYNRARYFGPSINGNHVGTGTRMYVGPGLKTITLEDQESVHHLHGARCHAYTTHEIFMSGFSAISGNHDSTVKNLIQKLARAAGSKVEFSGDYQNSSVSVTGTPTVLQ